MQTYSCVSSGVPLKYWHNAIVSSAATSSNTYTGIDGNDESELSLRQSSSTTHLRGTRQRAANTRAKKEKKKTDAWGSTVINLSL